MAVEPNALFYPYQVRRGEGEVGNVFSREGSTERGQHGAFSIASSDVNGFVTAGGQDEFTKRSLGVEKAERHPVRFGVFQPRSCAVDIHHEPSCSSAIIGSFLCFSRFFQSAG